MSKGKKILSINELRVGMIVAKDIILDSKILVAQGTPITESILSKLKDKYFFNKVEIFCDYNETIKDIEVKRPKTVEDIDNSFNELSLNVEGMFEYMEGLQQSNIEEVRKFAEKIEVELGSACAVIKNIVLYGSGEDAIYRHSVNVAALSSILGRWIGLNDVDVKLLTYSAILHDFGKTKLDKKILDKVGALTLKEFEYIKTHSIVGYRCIKDLPYLDKSVTYGVLMHHERLDGSGYPLGLKEKNIHPFAKIIAIADLFDAVNSNRIYKKSKGPFEALEIVQKEALGKLDYDYCKIFLSHVANYYIGESVMLNTNKVCKIIQIDPNDLGRPLLFDGDNFINLKQHKDLYIEKLIL